MTPRLLFVVGKGGVGRTTIATSLALAAGAAGQRSVVIELNGVGDIGRRFGHPRSYEAVEIGPNADWRSLTPRECVIDFGRRRLHLGTMSARFLGSRSLQRLLDAIPGVSDLLQLGKIENLLNDPAPGDPRYDLVVVDCPATGHGLSFLDAARTMTEISAAGPFHDLAETIALALADGTSGVVVTSLPERLPLAETLELLEALKERPVPLHQIVLNRVLPSPVPSIQAWPEVRTTLADLPGLRDLTSGLIDAWEEQRGVLETLSNRVTVPIWQVPLVSLPHQRAQITAALEPR